MNVKRAAVIGSDKLTYIIPKYVSIQTTEKCNLNCRYCALFGEGSHQIHSDKIMSMYVFTKILNDLKKYNFQGTIEFGHYCESLLDPLLLERLKLIKEYGFNLNILTNGTILKSSIHKKIIPDLYNVSLLGDLDGEFSYKYITGLDIDKTIDNIIDIHLMGIPIGIISTISGTSETTIRYLIKRLKSYPDIHITIGYLSHYTVPPISKGMINKIDMLMSDNNMNYLFALSFKLSSIQLQIKDNDKVTRTCDEIYNNASILINGDIELCCISRHIIGNVFYNNVIELYNSNYMIQLRRDLHSNSKYQSCISCFNDHK